MKKLSKPVLAISLSVILLLSTAVASFATEIHDPFDNCVVTKYEALR